MNYSRSSSSQYRNAIGRFLFLVLAIRVESSAPISSPGRGSNTRRLSFYEKNSLFDHKISGTDIDEDSGIGGPLTGDYDGLFGESGTQAGVIGQPSMDNSAGENIQTTAQGNSAHNNNNNNNNKYPNQHLYDSHSETIMTSESQQQQQQQTTEVFDGFEVTQQTQPTGYFDGFEVTNTKQAQNPGIYDGFEIDSGIASNYENRAQDISDAKDEQSSIRPMYITIYVGLAFASFLLLLCCWRESIISKRAKRKDQEKIDRLKNLYEGLDKYSTHVLDDRTKLDITLTPEQSPTYSPRRLVAIHMGNNADHTIEKIDFIDDIEFGESTSSDTEESLTDEMPALTMRMVRKTSGSREHWIRYSSDEFTIDSSGSDTSDKENANQHRID